VILASEYAPDLLEDVEAFLANVKAGKMPKVGLYKLNSVDP
jgi:hypothetical protein